MLKLFCYSDSIKYQTDDSTQFETYKAQAIIEGLQTVISEYFPYQILETGKIATDENGKPVPLSNTEKIEKGYLILESEKARIESLINSTFENSFAGIKAKYPQSEREGWTVLVEEAKNWIQNGKVENIPCLFAETGNTKDFSIITNLANKILANSLNYKTYYGQQKYILAQRLERLNLATTANEIYSIESEINS